MKMTNEINIQLKLTLFLLKKIRVNENVKISLNE